MPFFQRVGEAETMRLVRDGVKTSSESDGVNRVMKKKFFGATQLDKGHRSGTYSRVQRRDGRLRC